MINGVFSFNVMDWVLFGELERILVFVLIILCNYGRGILIVLCGCFIVCLCGVIVYVFLLDCVWKVLEVL